MKDFVLTEEFKKLNIGFALDEGMASPDEQFALFNGERTIWRKYFNFLILIMIYLYNYY